MIQRNYNYHLFFIVLLFTISLSIIQVVYADEVTLSNGTHIKGYIKEEDSHSITFFTPETTIKLNKSNIIEIKREPKSESFLYLADEFLKRKLYRYAQEYYIKANEAGIDKKTFDERLKQVTYLGFKENELAKADKIFEEKKYQKAVDEYMSLLTKYSDAPFADEIKEKISISYQKLAENAFDHVDPNAAYFYLQRALKYDPFSYRVHNTFATILSKQGLNQQALREYQESLKINPKQSDLQQTIAKLEVQYGKADTLRNISIITKIADAKIANIQARKELEKEIPIKERKLKNDALNILLQAYNAGPAAVVVYDGNVTYVETKQYISNVNYWLQKDINRNTYDEIIEKYAEKFDIDKNLVKAIIKVESDFNPGAISKANARGLMQITRTTWNDTVERLGLKWDYDQYVFDPEKNITVGCHYLSWLKSKYLPTFFGDIFA